MNVFLLPSDLQDLNSIQAVVRRPFAIGLRNLKLGCSNERASAFVTRLFGANTAAGRLKMSRGWRCVHIVVGITFLLPVVNTILLIACHHFKSSIPTAATLPPPSAPVVKPPKPPVLESSLDIESSDILRTQAYVERRLNSALNTAQIMVEKLFTWVNYPPGHNISILVERGLCYMPSDKKAAVEEALRSNDKGALSAALRAAFNLKALKDNLYLRFFMQTLLKHDPHILKEDLWDIVGGDEGDFITLAHRDQERRVHQVLFASLSPQFESAVVNSFRERFTQRYEIGGELSDEAFIRFARFIEEGSVKGIDEQTIMDLYALANTYSIKSLKQHCLYVLADMLKRKQCIDENMSLLEAARKLQDRDLEKVSSTLSFDNNSILSFDDGPGVFLRHYLSDATPLDTLKVVSKGIHKQSVKLNISDDSTLRKLTLSCEPIAIAELATLPQLASSLRKLSFKTLPRPVESFRSLHHFTQLTHLNLKGSLRWDYHTQDRPLFELASELKTHRTLTHLNLDNNDINDHGAWGLSEALRYNRVLRVLSLKGNLITTQGASHLAHALIVNRTLVVLKLYDEENPFAFARTQALGLSSLRNLVTLQKKYGRRTPAINQFLLQTLEHERLSKKFF